MPKPHSIKIATDAVFDAPISKLPNKRNLRVTRGDLQHEWENIQFMLDQGVYVSRHQIELAVNRQAEIEALLDELNS